MAEWIWSSEFSQRNAWLLFRKTFTVRSYAGEPATLAIFATDRYEAFVNGRPAGRGPRRFYPHRLPFYRHDVGHLLQPGKNVIAVRVNRFGEETFLHIVSTPGLWASLEIAGETRGGSNATWRVCRDPGYREDAPRMSIHQRFAEFYDGRRTRGDWRLPDFDDGRWPRAVTVDAKAFGRLVPCSGLPLTGDIKLPVRVVSSGTTSRPLRPYLVEMSRFFIDEPAFEPDNCHTKIERPFYCYMFLRITARRQTTLRIGADPNAQGPLAFRLDGKVLRFGHWVHPRGPAFTDDPASRRGPEAVGSKICKALVDVRIAKGEHLLTIRYDGRYGPAVNTFGCGIEENAGIKVTAVDGRPDASVAVRVDEHDRVNRVLWRAATTADVATADVPLRRIRCRTETADRTCQLAWAVYKARSRQLADAAVLCVDDGRSVAFPPGDPKHAPYAILDFGTEVVGQVAIELNAPEGTEVVLGFMEKFLGLEMMNSVGHLWTGYRSTVSYTASRGWQRWCTFYSYGFRYLVVHFRNATGRVGGSPVADRVEVRAVTLHGALYPLAGQAAFESSDPLANRIYEVGRRTIECCSLDTHVDCPGFEQIFWVHDGYPFQPFRIWDGSPEYVKDMIELIASAPDVSPFPPSSWGFHPSKYFIECPITFGYWPLTIEDYVMATGDMATLRRLYPLLVRQMTRVLDFCSADGLVEKVRGWYFIGWGKFDTDYDGSMTALSASLVGGLRGLSRLSRLLGRTAEARDYERRAQRTERGVLDMMWSEKDGAFIDCIHGDGTVSDTVGQETNALVGCFLNLPPHMREGVCHVLDDGPRTRGVNRTPSLGGEYFSLRAMFTMGFPERALARLRREWTPQVLDGATTFWEGKHPWSRSRCHVWAAGPNIFYLTKILGIRPLTPGQRVVEVAPYVEKFRFARGQVWTPYGLLEVSWHFEQANAWQLEIVAPRQVSVKVRIPDQTALKGVKRRIRVRS